MLIRNMNFQALPLDINAIDLGADLHFNKLYAWFDADHTSVFMKQDEKEKSISWLPYGRC